MSHWRKSAQEAIHEALNNNEGILSAAIKAGQWDDDGIAVTPEFDAIKKVLQDAYPFGVRQYHPYKIWLDEQRKALSRIANGKDPREATGFCMTKSDVRNFWV